MRANYPSFLADFAKVAGSKAKSESGGEEKKTKQQGKLVMSSDFACKQMAQEHVRGRGTRRLEVIIEFGVTPQFNGEIPDGE